MIRDIRDTRAALIARGLIVPRDQRVPTSAPIDHPTLHLDPEGRRVAAERVARGGVDRSLWDHVRTVVFGDPREEDAR